MAHKNTVKYRGKSMAELAQEERSLRNEIWKLRIQQTTGQLTDHHKIRMARRDLARVLSVMRELDAPQS